MKKIANINGVQKLGKEIQKTILGGIRRCTCSDGCAGCNTTAYIQLNWVCINYNCTIL